MQAIPILMYHRIGVPRPASIVAGQYVSERRFEAQMKLIQKLRYRTRHLHEWDRAFEQTDRQIVLTFDDGYRSFRTGALPVLARRQMTATVFLISSAIAKTNEWDIARGDVEEPMLSEADIASCQRAGIEFGSHSVTHPHLEQIPMEDCRREITQSKSELSQLLRVDVDSFCYPYGGQNAAVRQVVREAGYRVACSTKKHANVAATDPFELGRVNVRATTSGIQFLLKLRAATRLP